MGLPTLSTTALLLVLVCHGEAVGQAVARPTAVTEAERLRSAGDFSAAAKLLEAHHAAHPEDPDAARLLAQTLYWMGEHARARAVYVAGLERHPGTPALRFEFARMLVETGQRREARALLGPLVDDASWRGEAAALLGTIAYWDGDLPLAVRLFRAALAADPAHRDARRQLDEIRQVSTPWVKVGAGYWHDDQPLDRRMAAIEAGWFLTPLTPVAARVDGRRYTAGEPHLAAPTVEVEMSHVVPATRLQVKAIGGIVHRASGGGATDWVGSLAAGLRLPRGVTPGIRVERSAYFHTTASLATPVTFTGLSAAVTWNHAGWMAEAEHQRRRYFDQNEGWASFAWVLAPVVRTARSQYHLGYAVSASDTQQPRFSADGRYEPYHTPLDQRVHAALAAARWVGPRGHAVNLNASVGLRATETAPVPTGIPDVPLAERRFHPGTVRAGVVVPLSGSLVLNAHAEAGRASFYAWRAVSVNLTYRVLSALGPDAPGRASLRGGARPRPAWELPSGGGIPGLMRWPPRHGG